MPATTRREPSVVRAIALTFALALACPPGHERAGREIDLGQIVVCDVVGGGEAAARVEAGRAHGDRHHLGVGLRLERRDRCARGRVHGGQAGVGLAADRAERAAQIHRRAVHRDRLDGVVRIRVPGQERARLEVDRRRVVAGDLARSDRIAGGPHRREQSTQVCRRPADDDGLDPAVGLPRRQHGLRPGHHGLGTGGEHQRRDENRAHNRSTPTQHPASKQSKNARFKGTRTLRDCQHLPAAGATRLWACARRRCRRRRGGPRCVRGPRAAHA